MAKREGPNQSRLNEVWRELDLIFKGWDELDEESKKEKQKRIDQLNELETFYQCNILMTIASNLGLTECHQLLGQHGYKISNPEGAIVLSPIGQSAVVRMIREERMKRRKQWVEIVGPIIGAITGLLAVIVALVALLIRR